MFWGRSSFCSAPQCSTARARVTRAPTPQPPTPPPRSLCDAARPEPTRAQVFEDFLAQCSRNLTPNPDLACNRFIKFDALVEHAARAGCDAVATGHYARLGPGAPPALLRGVDRDKDQSYFLAAVRPDRLSAARFPLGAWLKPDVRRLAREAGLAGAAERRSSAGICFIGRRRFGEFLEQYLDPVPGEFVDAETGRRLGPCPNLLALTVGQRAGLAGGGARTYVAGKDAVARVAHVVTGWSGHPALLCRAALLRPAHWMDGGETAAALAGGATLRLQYKARYGQAPAGCTLRLAGHGPGFAPSQLCQLLPEDSGVPADALVAEFDEPATAITPQQAFVVYDGERCLGSALIARPGVTLFEEAGRAPVQRPEWLLARG